MRTWSILDTICLDRMQCAFFLSSYVVQIEKRVFLPLYSLPSADVRGEEKKISARAFALPLLFLCQNEQMNFPCVDERVFFLQAVKSPSYSVSNGCMRRKNIVDLFFLAHRFIFLWRSHNSIHTLPVVIEEKEKNLDTICFSSEQGRFLSGTWVKTKLIER